MHVTIKGLDVGVWKDLTDDERNDLLRAVGRPAL
jgi:hypothetical protein